MRRAGIEDISYYLPEKVVTNDDLAANFSARGVRRVGGVTGVMSRHVEEDSVPLSEMAVRAVRDMFAERPDELDSIDFIVLVTQTGDYKIPSTACIIQDKLGLPKTVGAFDINLGCSGYVYGLAVAQSLVESGISQRCLLIAAEKPMLHASASDLNMRILHGDAATATLISRENIIAEIGSYDVGSDGSGAKLLYIPAGGTVMPATKETREPVPDESGNAVCLEHTQMDGIAVYNFSTETVPVTIARTLEKNGVSEDDISYFVLHQASGIILDGIRNNMGLEEDRVPTNIDSVGNTSCASIPLILTDLLKSKTVAPGKRILLSGFGIGLSWASVVLTKK